MTPVVQLDPDFVFEAIPPVGELAGAHTVGLTPNPLGPLAELPGTWKGNGFNAIWRPHHPASPQDRFLELNLTTETLVFTRINGAIPNRGLADAGHQHVRRRPTCSRSSETSDGRRAAHRAGHLGHRSADQRPRRAAHGGADGVDPARHGDPRPGRRAGDARRPAAHPRQQHPPVLHRQPAAGQRRTSTRWRRRSPSSNLAIADRVPLRVPRRDPGDGQEPQQRSAAGARHLAAGHDA